MTEIPESIQVIYQNEKVENVESESDNDGNDDDIEDMFGNNHNNNDLNIFVFLSNGLDVIY